MIVARLRFAKRIAYTLAALLLVVTYYSNIASAAPIMDRTLTLGSSAAGLSTTYTFSFDIPSGDVLQSASFEVCTEASGACVTPTGFSGLGSSLSAQPTNLGDASGWTADSTASVLRLKKTGNTAAPSGVQTVAFSGVTNPSAENETFFVRITTYSDDAYTTSIDTGTVAASTAGQVTVSLVINEKLTFVLGETTVNLTEPTISSAGVGSSQMTVSTNGASGYTLTYSGNTLTSGSNTISAMAVQGVSVPNTKQFGINMRANTDPAIGSDVTGTGTGAPTAGYGTANQFKFNTSGDAIASASAPTNSNTFTASYIANADGVTAAGVYNTILTYIATANF